MTVEPNGDGGKVTYTVKDLLGKMDEKLDQIVEQLIGKVDVDDFKNLEGRVVALEARASAGDVARDTAKAVAETLAAKTKAERTFWDRWRMKVAWLAGIAVAASDVYTRFFH